MKASPTPRRIDPVLGRDRELDRAPGQRRRRPAPPRRDQRAEVGDRDRRDLDPGDRRVRDRDPAGEAGEETSVGSASRRVLRRGIVRGHEQARRDGVGAPDDRDPRVLDPAEEARPAPPSRRACSSGAADVGDRPQLGEQVLSATPVPWSSTSTSVSGGNQRRGRSRGRRERQERGPAGRRPARRRATESTTRASSSARRPTIVQSGTAAEPPQPACPGSPTTGSARGSRSAAPLTKTVASWSPASMSRAAW